MKKKLLALLQKKEERKKELGEKGKTTESVEELRSINAELEALNAEIAELRSMIDSLPDEEVNTEEEPDDSGEQRNQPQGQINILGAYGLNQTNQSNSRSMDPYDTPEYRSAFMDYVRKGVKSENLVFRADATTGVGDVGAVIPTSILNRVVEKMKDYGRIWSRVTKTSMPGGLQIPVSNAKPKATWVKSGEVAEKQKKQVTGNISFSYHKLQVRVAVEIVAETVSLPIFEQTLADNIYEAMIVALEEAIINGSGTGEPLGIVKDSNIPTNQMIELAPEDFGKYKTWTTVFGKVPRRYRSGTVLILADADWTKYIEGMTDTSGQPIARVTYGLDGTIQEKLLGKEVIPVEEYLPSIDDAEAGEVVGILVKLSDYMVNSNMQMTFKRYFDENTDEWISKSTLIADGKLSDRNGVVLIKKKA
ncbi:phage major capsid protein [Fervidibacillus albus]|uniref:Phage major capsid protein n=1 Tax=Fervidibacillus albus TaxID=2980026 RepID=A0A9E8LVP5_9BACI|nr:phage major capsid protein [Fervidibacillus albus]WAA10327.1 phage major capsid protein [Fervidibacillus albus]